MGSKRPRMYSKKKKEEVLEALNETLGIISSACKKVNISRDVFYKWYNSEPWFKEEADRIQAEQIDFVESKLIECINDKDHTAIIFYLKTKGRNRGWKEVNDINIQNGNIKIIFSNKELNNDDKTV